MQEEEKPYSLDFEQQCLLAELELLQKLRRPLTGAEKNALRNTGSFMMLESAVAGLLLVDDLAECEQRLAELVGFRKAFHDALAYMFRFFMKHSFEYSDDELILLHEKGNCQDIMELFENYDDMPLAEAWQRLMQKLYLRPSA